MSYSESLTAALGGVSVHQLRGWRTGPNRLFVPEASPERPVRYSFRDLIAVRTFAALRSQFSLQKIRKAVANLHSLEDVDHLSNYQLVGDGNTIVWATGNDMVDILKRPGQQLLIQMRDVLGEFEGWRGARIVPLRRPKPGLEIDPDVLRGFPVIEDTRIPYDMVAELAADGLDTPSIQYFYPSVTDTGVSGAVAFQKYVAEYNGLAA